MKYTHVVKFVRGTKEYFLHVVASSDAEARTVAEKAMTRKMGSKLTAEFKYLSTEAL